MKQSSSGCLGDSTTRDGCKELEGAPDPLLHLSIVGVGEDIFLGFTLLPIPVQLKVPDLGLGLAKGVLQLLGKFFSWKTGFMRQAGLKSDLGGVVGPQSGLCCPPGKNSIKKYYVLHKDDIQAEAP